MLIAEVYDDAVRNKQKGCIRNVGDYEENMKCFVLNQEDSKA